VEGIPPLLTCINKYMHVEDLLYNYEIGILEPIKIHCTQFLDESGGFPVVKNLPQTYEDFQKVKVRKRKHTNTFSSMFNGAFKNEMTDLRERSIFANGIAASECDIMESVEPFYVFPINGFKFLYSKEVDNSTENYQQVFESILDKLGEESGKDMVSDLLRFSYISENLSAGIHSGAEIIIYGIPYYYAIRESRIDDYDELLTTLV
jgi:hypothetical protein